MRRRTIAALLSSTLTLLPRGRREPASPLLGRGKIYLKKSVELLGDGSAVRNLRPQRDWLASISSALSTPSGPNDFSTYEYPSL